MISNKKTLEIFEPPTANIGPTKQHTCKNTASCRLENNKIKVKLLLLLISLYKAQNRE